MVLSIKNNADSARSRYRGSFPISFLLMSLAVHAALFIVGQKAVSLTFTPPRPQLFHVHLLRDPLGADSEYPEPVETDPAPTGSFQFQKEDTIRLDEEKGEYVDYARIIKKRLASAWIYPEQARIEAMEGTVRMLFTLERDGKLSASRLLHSSNHACLDENVMDAVNHAAPYPPFPDHFSISRLHIEASFTYRMAASISGTEREFTKGNEDKKAEKQEKNT